MWGVVSLVFGFVELLVGMRFVMLLVGASLESGLVRWIYDITNPLIAPFGTVFGHSVKVVEGTLTGSYFEPASLVALVVYGAVGGILLKVLANHTGGRNY